MYTSATGIVRLTKRRLALDAMPSTLRTGEISAKTVFDAVKAGDALAIEVAKVFGEYLGKALASIAESLILRSLLSAAVSAKQEKYCLIISVLPMRKMHSMFAVG